jgi:hypothetical protein
MGRDAKECRLGVRVDRVRRWPPEVPMDGRGLQYQGSYICKNDGRGRLASHLRLVEIAAHAGSPDRMRKASGMRRRFASHINRVTLPEREKKTVSLPLCFHSDRAAFQLFPT